MSNNNMNERSMFPFILGSFLLFLMGTFGTVVLPFFDDSMQRPNANAELRSIAFEHGSPEARGREIYIREGCMYCHTQFVRPVKADTHLGPVSVPEDYYYDAPNLLGTKRTGADLMWTGYRWTAEWHRENLIDPRRVLPGSIMPSYAYLTDEELDDLVAYLMTLRPAPQTEGREE